MYVPYNNKKLTAPDECLINSEGGKTASRKEIHNIAMTSRVEWVINTKRWLKIKLKYAG